MTDKEREALEFAAEEFTRLTGCKWEVVDHWQEGPIVVDKQHKSMMALGHLKDAMTGNLQGMVRTTVGIVADFSDEPIGIVAWHQRAVEYRTGVAR